MDKSENVVKISLEEASKIDANEIAFYTLTDGTIIRVKREGEEAYGEQSQGQDKNISQKQNVQSSSKKNNIYIQEQKAELQNNYEANQMSQQSSSNKYQEQSQIQNQQVLSSSENENNLQINSGIQENAQYSGQILQPGVNYGYYISGGDAQRNYVQKQQIQYNQQPQGFLSYNAKLINAEICDDQLFNQLNLQNLSLSGAQIVQQGGQFKKRQLYKLIHAIPVNLSELTGTETINTQMSMQQYNNDTYRVEKLRHQNFKQKMGMNSQGQNNYNLNAGKNFSFNTNYLQNQINNDGYEQYGQKSQTQKCTCKNKSLKKIQNKSLFQNDEFCNCDLNYSESSQKQGRSSYNVVSGSASSSAKRGQCTCPIGKTQSRSSYKVVTSQYYEQ